MFVPPEMHDHLRCVFFLLYIYKAFSSTLPLKLHAFFEMYTLFVPLSRIYSTWTTFVLAKQFVPECTNYLLSLSKMSFHPNNIKKSLHFGRSETACDPASERDMDHETYPKSNNLVFKFNQVYTDQKRNVTLCSTDQ